MSWTGRIASQHPRARRPLAEHAGLTRDEADETAGAYRALGYSPADITISETAPIISETAA